MLQCQAGVTRVQGDDKVGNLREIQPTVLRCTQCSCSLNKDEVRV
jgi:hypothetical protein